MRRIRSNLNCHLIHPQLKNCRRISDLGVGSVLRTWPPKNRSVTCFSGRWNVGGLGRHRGRCPVQRSNCTTRTTGRFLSTKPCRRLHVSIHKRSYLFVNETHDFFMRSPAAGSQRGTSLRTNWNGIGHLRT